MTGTAPAGSPASLLRRVARTMALAALVLLPALALAAWMALRAPLWWQPGSRTDAAAADRAAAFEQSVVAAFTQVRPDAPEWSLLIRVQDVNDWLATRLPAWLESRGEAAPEAVQTRFEPGRVFVGVRVGPVVPWWRVSPSVRDGALVLEGAGGGIGRLPLPLVGQDLESRWRDAGLARPIRLADGRLVRVLGLEAAAGELHLRLRTEPRSEPSPRP